MTQTTLLITMILIGCFTENFYNLDTVSLIRKYPTFYDNKGDKIMYFSDTITIFNDNELTLYKLGSTIQLETNEPIFGSNQYFLFKKNAKNGLLFLNLDDKKPTTAMVDSIIYSRGGKAKEDADLPSDTLWKFIGSNQEKGLILDTYAIIKSICNQYPDSIFYYYNKNLNCQYSLSKKLDEKKSMKLCKYRIVLNPTFDKGVMFPKREFSLEIKKSKASNEKDIKEFIEVNEYLLKGIDNK